jgi:hypothetical protein
MKCKYCGAEIANDSTFCEHCGKQVGKDKAKRSKLIFIICSIIVIAACIGIAVYILRQPKPDKEVQSERVTDTLRINDTVVSEAKGIGSNDGSSNKAASGGFVSISASKMNVLYAGLKNPIEISYSGTLQSVKFSGCVVSGSGAQRNVVPPTSMIGKTVDATVTTSEGSSKMTFRVKKVPDPYIKIGANIFGGKRSKAELTANPALIVKMSEDFAFDLKWTVISYSVDVNEKNKIETINCSGPKFSQELIDKINSASAGTVFTFSNIKITQDELGSRTIPDDIIVRIK